MSPDTSPPSGTGSNELIRYVIEEQRNVRADLSVAAREQRETSDRIWQSINKLRVDLTEDGGERKGDYRVLCKEIAHQSMRISVIISSIVSVIVGTVVAVIARFFFA